MSSTTSIFAIILSAVLTNNFIFSQFLGCCPFLGCSSKIDTAAGMGLAVTFVMGLASAICWLVNCLLVKLGLGFLQTIAYILVIAALVQFIEMFLKKSIPSLYHRRCHRHRQRHSDLPVRVRRARAHAPDRWLYHPRLPDCAHAVRAAQVCREEGSQGKSARSAGKGGGIT